MPAFQASALNRSATSPRSGIRGNYSLGTEKTSLKAGQPETESRSAGGGFMINVLKGKGKPMPGPLKFFTILFAVLAVASVGHDVWRSRSTGNPFAFSELGGLCQLYAREHHDRMREAIADTLGPEFFNAVFVPVLSTHTVVLTGALAAVFGLWGWLILQRRRTHAPKQSGFRYRRN